MRHRKILSSLRNVLHLRTYSQKADVAKSASPGLHSSTARQPSRIDRFISRSPKFLHKHLQSLRNAPVTHISAFLILHELTAVIPLFGLAGAFHYYNWLPTYFAEGVWVVAGVEKFGRYARRKGWISEREEQEIKEGEEATDRQPGKWFDKSEGGVRWVVEFATAYAIVKAFMVPRLILSAWAAPWFARWTVVPVLNMFKVFRTKATHQRRL